MSHSLVHKFFAYLIPLAIHSRVFEHDTALFSIILAYVLITAQYFSHKYLIYLKEKDERLKKRNLRIMQNLPMY